MQSIIQKEKVCYFCGRTDHLEEHHCISGSGFRKLAEKYGLKVWLCEMCHRDGKTGVHGQGLRKKRQLQKVAQRAFERLYGHAEWMRIFMRNYL